MVNLLINNKRYDLLDFDSEEEFEKAVIENSKSLFGKDCIYIDVKKRIGKNESYHKGVPDGYLIDFTSKKQPQLYFIENELVTHDIYNHISEQIVRFSAAIKTSQNQIRNKLLEIIKGDSHLKEELIKNLKETPFSNVDELIFLALEFHKKHFVQYYLLPGLSNEITLFQNCLLFPIYRMLP